MAAPIRRGYRGSTTLSRAGSKHSYTAHEIVEFKKCRDSIEYFSETYVYHTNTDDGFKAFPLYTYQKQIINACKTSRYVIAECARQSGKTTVMTMYILHYMIFGGRHKRVAILANKADTAREIFSRIKMAFEALPAFLKPNILKWNESMMLLENGNRIIAAATSATNIRGFSNNIVFIDEAAHIEKWDKFSASVLPTISSGKTTQIILVSTVNGLNHFYKMTDAVRKGKSDYKLVSVTWREVPGRDENWRKKALDALGGSEELFEQEYENRYLGSGNTLISGSKLQALGVGEIPIIRNAGIQMYIPPEKGRQYVAVCDVSRGRGLDYSTMQVIDVSEVPYKQCLTFRSNVISTGDFAEVISRVGRQYNECPVLIEINDIGEACAETLYYEFEYPNVLFTEANGRNGYVVTHNFTFGKTNRGIRTTTPVKKTGCSMLKALVEGDRLLVIDYETIHELSTFSKKDNKHATYEATEGHHDDLVMPLVLFGWLTNTQYFKDLTNINTVMALKDTAEERMHEDLLPFGFVGDGMDMETEVINGDIWITVHDDPRYSHGGW